MMLKPQAIERGDSQQAVENDLAKQDHFPLLLGLFLCLQTLLDNYVLLTAPELSIAGVSIVTIIRYLGVIALAGYVFLIQESRLPLKIIPLLLVIAIYTALHLMVRDSISLPPEIDRYSVISEFSYIIRIFMPIVLLMVVARSKVDIHYVARILSIILLLAGGMILFTSLLKVSLGSYTNQQVEISILEWFISGGTSYSAVAAKGFFYFANQAAALMTLCMPFTLLALIRSRSKISALAVVMGSFGMVALGTRAALLGALLTLAMGFSFVLYELFVTRRGSWKPGALILLLILTLLALAPSSPAMDRLNIARSTSEIADEQTKNPAADQKSEVADEKPDSSKPPISPSSIDTNKDAERTSLEQSIKKPMTNEQIEAFKSGQVIDITLPDDLGTDEILALLKRTKLNEHFFTESYPVELDAIFWITAAKLPADRQLDYRFMERAMLARITSLQEAPAVVDALGLGASRQEGIFNIEQDVFKQYYAVGWVGLLLFFTWFIIPLLAFIARVFGKRSRKDDLMELLTPVIATILVIVIAIQSGNVLDALLISLPAAAITGVSLRECRTASM